LLGAASGGGSLGGVLATNLSGPRRPKAGAARDHFLGFSAVSGRGETFKSGGRVVKNVTGYDLCKLMAGSFGTLGAMTDVTIKTLPRAETQATLLVSGLDGAQATRAMADAMSSSFDVSGAAHLPAAIAGAIAGLDGAQSATLFRLEGVGPSVAHRTATLAAGLKAFGAAQALPEEVSRDLWRGIRDVTPFVDNSLDPVWRISTAPMQGATLAAGIAEALDGAWFLDWAGGLIWLSLPVSDDAGAELLRPMVASAGGHATLIRADAAVRAAVDVFQPQDEGVAALSRRVKESFDPKGVLNPGRMWAGV
jgi:glycolate oxidase FAD binding subunit